MIVAVIVNGVALLGIARHYYTSDRITIDTAVYDLTDTAVVPIREGTHVTQTVTPRFNRLVRIDLDVALYGRSISDGDLVVQVLSSAGETLSRQMVSLRGAVEGAGVSVRFGRAIDSKGRPLRVELSLEGAAAGAMVGLYATGGTRDVYEDGVLTVDGIPLPKRDLTFRAYRRGRNDSRAPDLTPPSHRANQPLDPSREDDASADVLGGHVLAREWEQAARVARLGRPQTQGAGDLEPPV